MNQPCSRNCAALRIYHTSCRLIYQLKNKYWALKNYIVLRIIVFLITYSFKNQLLLILWITINIYTNSLIQCCQVTDKFLFTADEYQKFCYWVSQEARNISKFDCFSLKNLINMLKTAPLQFTFVIFLSNQHIFVVIKRNFEFYILVTSVQF